MNQPAARPLELSITRVFAAPRELVFRMFSDPGHMRRWSCPEGFTIPRSEGEFREGGHWYVHMRAPDGADHHVQGAYREIDPPRRIVFTHAWLDENGMPGVETVITVTLEAQGEATRLTLHQIGFDSPASRDGHEAGWSECLDKLKRLLGEGR